MPEVAYSTDEENFNFDSLEEALDSMDDPQPGDVIYAGDVVQRPASYYLPKMEWLLEQMGEKAWDEAGEHADDWPGRGITDEGEKALDAGIKALIDQHVKVNFWTIANVRRIEVTAEMIAARDAPAADGVPPSQVTPPAEAGAPRWCDYVSNERAKAIASGVNYAPQPYQQAALDALASPEPVSVRIVPADACDCERIAASFGVTCPPSFHYRDCPKYRPDPLHELRAHVSCVKEGE